MAVRTIDLNADLGEGMGDDEAMLRLVTSANVACGGHAGDRETMAHTLRAAAGLGVTIGAHPGYPDREHFGRRDLDMTPDEIGAMVVGQVRTLQEVAAAVPTEVSYVKLHGALANLAARSEPVATAVVEALAALDPALPILAISGTTLEVVARAAGTPVFSEVYADRGYLPTGQLVPRSEPGAVLHDPDEVADRMLSAVTTGRLSHVGGGSLALAADSICLHGDTDGALDMARTLRDRLVAADVDLRSFVRP